MKPIQVDGAGVIVGVGVTVGVTVGVGRNVALLDVGSCGGVITYIPVT